MRNYSRTVLTALLTTLMAVSLGAAAELHATHQSPAASNPDAVASESSKAMANMQKMQQQMAAIHAAKDPQERATLMQEHMHTMQATLELMHPSGCRMMGQMMSQSKNEDATMQDMQSGSGADMMQMMMEQMKQHQQLMQSMDK